MRTTIIGDERGALHGSHKPPNPTNPPSGEPDPNARSVAQHHIPYYNPQWQGAISAPAVASNSKDYFSFGGSAAPPANPPGQQITLHSQDHNPEFSSYYNEYYANVGHPESATKTHRSNLSFPKPDFPVPPTGSLFPENEHFSGKSSRKRGEKGEPDEPKAATYAKPTNPVKPAAPGKKTKPRSSRNPGFYLKLDNLGHSSAPAPMSESHVASYYGPPTDMSHDMNFNKVGGEPAFESPAIGGFDTSKGDITPLMFPPNGGHDYFGNVSGEYSTMSHSVQLPGGYLNVSSKITDAVKAPSASSDQNSDHDAYINFSYEDYNSLTPFEKQRYDRRESASHDNGNKRVEAQFIPLGTTQELGYEEPIPNGETEPYNGGKKGGFYGENGYELHGRLQPEHQPPQPPHQHSHPPHKEHQYPEGTGELDHSYHNHFEEKPHHFEQSFEYNDKYHIGHDYLKDGQYQDGDAKGLLQAPRDDHHYQHEQYVNHGSIPHGFYDHNDLHHEPPNSYPQSNGHYRMEEQYDAHDNNALEPHSHNGYYEELGQEEYSTDKQDDSELSSEVKAARKRKGAKGVICSVCDKFISRDFSRHMRIHDEAGRFRCVFPPEYCKHKSRKFNRPYDYKKHLLNFHFKFEEASAKLAPNLGEKLSIRGQCISCGQRFIANDWLNDHILTTDPAKKCPELRRIEATHRKSDYSDHSDAS